MENDNDLNLILNDHCKINSYRDFVLDSVIVYVDFIFIDIVNDIHIWVYYMKGFVHLNEIDYVFIHHSEDYDNYNFPFEDNSIVSCKIKIKNILNNDLVYYMLSIFHFVYHDFFQEDYNVVIDKDSIVVQDDEDFSFGKRNIDGIRVKEVHNQDIHYVYSIVIIVLV